MTTKIVDETPRRRWVPSGTLLTDSWIFLVLVALVVFFSLARPNFLSAFNLTNILVSAAAIVIIAVGQTYVIVTGGIDLSVGSVLVFSGVIAAVVMGAMGGSHGSGVTSIVGMAVGLLAGAAWGVLNGCLVALTRIPPLIVTLGSTGMALGLAQLMTGGVDLSDVPPSLVATIGFGKLASIPVVVVIAVIVAVIGEVVLRKTRYGRHTYAIGSNAEAARRAGVHVRSHLIRVYAMQGLVAGLAGMLLLARYSSTTIAGHNSDNLTVIAGVVLGGTSLFGGYGRVIGSVVGVLIPIVLQNGLVILGLQPFWQTVLIGAVLILAVYIDQRKRASR